MSSFSRRSKDSPNPRQASGWETTGSPPPPPRLGQRPDIVESGGAALVDAQDAFIDSRRAVWTRIVWSLPSEHDARVLEVLERIGKRDVRDELARLGVDRYLQTGRGAIFCNAGYNAGSERLAVDWVTFRDTQMTRDKLLQQDVLLNAVETKNYAACERRSFELYGNIETKEATGGAGAALCDQDQLQSVP
ncbi:hypothetical protein FRC06_003709 [Ceratobasidium sp. 370]|nr:hypothetical protein FRC06_003709 [Ceratobasidium sp. 370]